MTAHKVPYIYKTMFFRCVILSFLLSGSFWVPVSGVIAAETVVRGKSGYLVPRFVSLARDKVFVRTGPARKYPITWTFQRKKLPIKVIAEYKDWRKIIDSEGATGWIWAPLLSSKRSALILNDQQPLLEKPEETEKTSVIAEEGVVGKLLECDGIWCRLEVGGLKGWLLQREIWGALDGEVFD